MKTRERPDIVVWVEDLERFCGVAPGKEEELDESQAEKLNTLRALLHGLERLRQVNVVTATTSLYMRFDPEKIARFIESIPALPRVRVGAMIDSLRSKCLGMQGLIDPLAPGAREVFADLEKKYMIYNEARIDTPGAFTPGLALVELCETPRRLKTAMVLVREAWDLAPGEIDFDHLLVMSVLRCEAPEQFSWLESEIRRRKLLRVGDNNAAESEKRMSEYLGEHEEDSRYLYIEKVVRFMLETPKMHNRPQGVLCTEEDYLQRLLTPVSVPEELRDQRLLENMTIEGIPGFASILEDPSESVRAARFSCVYSIDECWKTLEILVERRRSESPRDWPSGGYLPPEPPGFYSLYLAFGRRDDLVSSSDVSTLGIDILSASLKASLCRNAWLSVWIKELFVGRDSSFPEVWKSEGYDSSSRKAYWELLNVCIEQHEEEFASGFSHCPAEALYCLIYDRQVNDNHKRIWTPDEDAWLEFMRKLNCLCDANQTNLGEHKAYLDSRFPGPIDLSGLEWMQES